MGWLSDLGNNALGTVNSIVNPVLSVGKSLFKGLEDFIPGIGDSKAQAEANRINQLEAQINREFQERMSNTAYQRATKDMRSAGINPMLAYMQGGASAPSGSQATVQSASKTGLFDAAMKATTGIGSLSQQRTALEQQKSMNESAIQLNATTAAKNVADAQRTREETKGLGKKASEGELWDKFYKKINSVLDSSAKDQSSMYNKMNKHNEMARELMNKSSNKKLKDVMMSPSPFPIHH